MVCSMNLVTVIGNILNGDKAGVSYKMQKMQRKMEMYVVR